MTTAGQKLKATRLSKNLSLEDVSKSTKIKPLFLEYIENGEYHKLPSVSYAHGFVRNYALFLGLDEKEIMALFRREFDYEKSQRVLPKSFGTEQEFTRSRIRIYSTVLLIVFILILFTGYILFQYRNAFLDPPLTIISPKDNTAIYSSVITIYGKTDPDDTVYIDQNEVRVDSNGYFTKTLDVFPGALTINIRSINKFQRETDQQINLSIKGS